MTRDTGLLRQPSLRGNHRRVTSANSCQAAREGKGQSLAGRMEREAVSPKPVTPDRQWPHWTEPRGNLSILPRGAAPGPTAQNPVAPPPSCPPVSLLASCAPRPASLQRQEGLTGLGLWGVPSLLASILLTPQTGGHASGEVRVFGTDSVPKLVLRALILLAAYHPPHRGRRMVISVKGETLVPKRWRPLHPRHLS